MDQKVTVIKEKHEEKVQKAEVNKKAMVQDLKERKLRCIEKDTKRDKAVIAVQEARKKDLDTTKELRQLKK